MSRRHRRPPSPSTAVPAPPPGAGPSAQPIWPAFVIAVAAVLAYANTLSAPFIFDDTNAITSNPSIRHFGDALFPPTMAGSAAARPLINLSFALNYALGGERVEGYHALNLLIHLAAGLALFGLVRRTLLLPVLSARWGAVARPVAFFTALLWTVHPLLTESVTCVAQRTESLVGLWYLLMFYCLARAAEPDAPRRWLIGSFVACLLGVLTKEVMVAAPVLALLFHVALIDGSWRAAGARRGKFFGLLLLTWVPLAWLVAHNSSRGGAAGFGLGVAWWEYALTQCRAIIIYLKLSFWPHPLVLDYGDTVVRDWREVWPQALLLAGLVGATVVAWFRKIPAAFAGVWFFAILAPSSSVVPLLTQTIAEHRMYLPLAAVVMLAVTGLYALAGRRSYFVLAALALVLAGLTVRRNAVYRSAVDLWRDTVARAPGNIRARSNLGDWLDNAGREVEAMREYEGILAIQPRNPVVHYNLANVLARRHQLPEAIEHYLASLRVVPDRVDTHINLGNAYTLLARLPEAEAEFSTALRINPDEALAHNNLGGVLVRLGRPAEAVTHYEAAMRIVPNQSFQFNLACALTAAGRLPEAITQFQAVLRSAPGRADAHYRLGMLLAYTGQRDQGSAELAEALRLKPDYAEARAQLEQLQRSPPP